MKRLFLILCLMLFSVLPTFAGYKPIPKELSAQYKAEMEEIIDQNYAQVIKNIDAYFNEIQKNYNKIIYYGCDVNVSVQTEVSIHDVDLLLYGELLKVTQEKYLKKTYPNIGTDDSNLIAEDLYPYFKDNNVDFSKLVAISKYASNKEKIIQQYQYNVNKMCRVY